MNSDIGEQERYVHAIRASGLDMYDHIDIGDPDLWIPSQELEQLLEEGLIGMSCSELPLRTRSKVVNQRICDIIGYPVPSTFRRTKPKFPGQLFDVYVQKSNNLQIWNEDISANRRYVIVRLNQDDAVVKVRVVLGSVLSRLDTTGTLTQKYQAQLTIEGATAELVAPEDTEVLKTIVSDDCEVSDSSDPTADPDIRQLLPINKIFESLSLLLGCVFPDPGRDQERNRAAKLHLMVCNQLGYRSFHDDGNFPDLRHQLLEVKLQTSPTIDLGIVAPNSTEALDIRRLNRHQVRHCDVRYALFYGDTDGSDVTISHLFVTTGERFFTRFPQFQGKILNKKLQITLPSNFFDG